MANTSNSPTSRVLLIFEVCGLIHATYLVPMPARYVVQFLVVNTLAPPWIPRLLRLLLSIVIVGIMDMTATISTIFSAASATLYCYAATSVIRRLILEIGDEEVIGDVSVTALSVAGYASAALGWSNRSAFWSAVWFVFMGGLATGVVYLLAARLAIVDGILASLHRRLTWFANTSGRSYLSCVDGFADYWRRPETTPIPEIEAMTYWANLTDTPPSEALARPGDRPQSVYDTLPDGSIRLLRLHRISRGHDIQCSIIVVPLATAPEYEAISYRWGNDDPSTPPIYVSGVAFHVTPTVRQLLARRASFFYETLFWIDSICINQKDMDERSRQVAMMRDIYVRACRVLVWLGPRRDEASADAPSMAWVLMRMAVLQQTSPRKTDPSWRAIVAMLEHEWFERSWVVQEVVVGGRVLVMYGNALIKWETLAKGAEAIMDSAISESLGRPGPGPRVPAALHMNLGAAKNITSIQQLRLRHHGNEPGAERLELLQDALMAGLTNKAGEAHDKVYAFLGITREGMQQRIKPNYSTSVSDVYIDTMRVLIEGECPNFHPLELAGIGFARSDELDSSLPSWVVDWSCNDKGRMVVSMLGLGRVFHCVDVLTDARGVIRLQGQEVDRLETLTGETLVFDHKPGFDDLMVDLRHFYLAARRLALMATENAVQLATLDRFWCAMMGVAPEPGRGWNVQRLLQRAIFEEFLVPNIAAMQAHPEHLSVFTKIGNACGGRRFCVSKLGNFLLVPPMSQRDDVVCFIEGLSPAALLRETNVVEEDGHEIRHCRLVGFAGVLPKTAVNTTPRTFLVG